MSNEQNKKTRLEKWAMGGILGAAFAAVVAVNYFDPFVSQEEKFVDAAESGHIENMDRALENGADIEDWAGFNALSAASENGKLDAVKYLFTLHDFDESEIYRAAAKAAEGGHNDIIAFFISEGLDVNSGFIYGSSLLQGATYENRSDTVKFLLQNGVDVTNPNTRSSGALGYALQEGYTEIVVQLLDAGMGIYTETYRGDVLSGAAAGGHKDIVELALGRGADVAANNHDATRKAAEYGHTKILDLLIERGGSMQAANEGLAIRAARRGDIGKFREIFQEQPEVLQTVGGRLMAGASYNNNINFVEMLIEEGLTSAEDMGSALIFAAQDGYDDILELLLSQNADFQNAEYDYLNSALFYAAQNNHEDSVELLLAHGADPRVNAGHHTAPINMTNSGRAITRMFKDYLAKNPTVAPVPSLP